MKSKKRYESYNHAKYSIKYHIILSVKYHRKILGKILDDVKRGLFLAQPDDGSWRIKVVDTDLKERKDHHIHLLVKARPTASPSGIVARLKQFSTNEAWTHNGAFLKSIFWNGKRHLWTRGYFCATIGEASEETIREYIQKQG